MIEKNFYAIRLKKKKLERKKKTIKMKFYKK